jgi:hypothetical protein
MVIHGFRNQQNVPAKNYNCNARRGASEITHCSARPSAPSFTRGCRRELYHAIFPAENWRMPLAPFKNPSKSDEM